MIAAVTVVVPPWAVLTFLAFLVLLAVLGKLAAAATRGPADGERGCLGGCGLFAVILLFCALGIAGFVAFVATLGGVTAIENNPIRSIELLAPNTEHNEYGNLRRHEVPMLLRIRTVGDHEEAIEKARKLLERYTDIDREAFDHVTLTEDDEGTLIEIMIPIDQHDLRRLQRELDDWDIEAGGGVRIFFDEQRGV